MIIMTELWQTDLLVRFSCKIFLKKILLNFPREKKKIRRFFKLLSTFLEVFLRNFQRLKACIQNDLFFHCPTCITPKDEKTCKKGVDRMHWSWYYIQVVAIRQQNKSQNRKTWTLKTEHKPRKSECAGRARKRKTKSNNFFFNNKS